MIDGILEFTFRPVSNKKRAISIFFTLLIIGALLVIASVVAPIYKGVISLVAVIVLTVSVYIYIRYVSGEYAYVIAYAGEYNPVFIVTKTVGKNVTTLFNIGVGSICSVTKESAAQRKAHVTASGVQKHNYIPSIGAEYTYRIKTAGAAPCEILIEGNDALADRLVEYSALMRKFEEDQ